MLKKFLLKPGVNRENTRYTTEGGWYSSDKVRFRQGTPEKIGGWARISANTFLGICRSLWVWATQSDDVPIGVMTSTRQYVSLNGVYADIGPNTGLTNGATFAATPGSSLITVYTNLIPATTYWAGAWVVIENQASLGGNITSGLLNGKHTIVSVVSLSPAAFTIDAGVQANSSDTGNGGGAATARFFEPAWSQYASQANFGQDLLFVYRGGYLCSWPGGWTFFINATTVGISCTSSGPVVITTTNPYNSLTNSDSPLPVVFNEAIPPSISAGVKYYLKKAGANNIFNVYTTSTYSGSPINGAGTYSLTTTVDISALRVFDEATAANSPDAVNYILVSDVFRFVFCFGVNNYGVTGGTFPSKDLISPMLIRWCNQEDYTDWTPSATNQAGSLILSRGSEIITAAQARQEVLVWTDAALYSLQYLGADPWWGAQIVGDNISIVSQNAWAYAAGTAFWMGRDKFYLYNGNVTTLNCDLRQYVFSDINTAQYDQVFANTNEGFNEIWWFYCSANSSTIDRYVVYNYVENIWYYGNMARTAWADSGLRDYPVAATYLGNLVNHELGVDDDSTGTPVAIPASITSSEFDADDGDKFVFIKRVLPDLTFRGSTAGSPSGVLTFNVLKNSGSGYMSPASEGGSNDATVTRTATVPIEAFTGQVYVRLRARQLSMKWESTGLGVTWQLGAMRLDMQPDGKASGSGVSGG
jgi:hypothetical protein